MLDSGGCCTIALNAWPTSRPSPLRFGTRWFPSARLFLMLIHLRWLSIYLGLTHNPLYCTLYFSYLYIGLGYVFFDTVATNKAWLCMPRIIIINSLLYSNICSVNEPETVIGLYLYEQLFLFGPALLSSRFLPIF